MMKTDIISVTKSCSGNVMKICQSTMKVHTKDMIKNRYGTMKVHTENVMKIRHGATKEKESEREISLFPKNLSLLKRKINERERAEVLSEEKEANASQNEEFPTVQNEAFPTALNETSSSAPTADAAAEEEEAFSVQYKQRPTVLNDATSTAPTAGAAAEEEEALTGFWAFKDCYSPFMSGSVIRMNGLREVGNRKGGSPPRLMNVWMNVQ